MQRTTRSATSLRRILCLAAVPSLLAVLAPGATAVAAPDEAPVTQIGTLERFPAEAVAAFGNGILRPPGEPDSHHTFLHGGTLLPLLEAGQLWQVWPFERSQFSGVNAAGIAVRDARTLRIVKTFMIPYKLLRGSNNSRGGGEWMHAFDPVGRRVFLGVADRHVVEIDLDTFTVKPRFDFWMASTPDVGPYGEVPKSFYVIGGMTYDPFADALIGLVGGPSSFNVANVNTFMYKRDLRTGAREGPRPLSSCTAPCRRPTKARPTRFR